MSRRAKITLLLVALVVGVVIDWMVGTHGAATLVLGLLWFGVETGLLTRWLRNSDEPPPNVPPDPRYCMACGYALEGLPDNVLTCPECGVERPTGPPPLH